MLKDPKKLLFDISESIDFIFNDHLKQTNSLADYEADRTIQDAVERRLMTIGEAIYKLRNEGMSLPFADQIINRRNTLAHQYDIISAATIWFSVHNELPVLQSEVDRLLAE